MRATATLAVLGVLALGCALRGPAHAPPLSGWSPPAPTGAPERLLVVTIAGLEPDSYLAREPAMPILAALARAGAAAEAMKPVFPATVYTAHATLATGVEPARHGISGDHRLVAQGVSPGFLDKASDLRAPTLAAAVVARGGRVASLDWPSTGGAAIEDLAPDLVLDEGVSWADALGKLGAGRAAELAGRVGGSAPGARAPGAVRDAALVTMACSLLVGDAAPRLLMLRLSETAIALDQTPARSDAAAAAFAAVDAELGRLMHCLGDAGLLATTAVAVAGDFARAPVHTELRPNTALADAGLLVPDGTGIRKWDAIARADGSTAFVYAADDDAAVLARRALDAFANETRASRVVSAKEMVARGADPEAWFGLEAEPGFVFGDATAGGPMAAARLASASTADETRARTGFVAWGPGVRAGVRIPVMRQTDVAPTLAYWLGASLEGVQGRALVGLFGAGGS